MQKSTKKKITKSLYRNQGIMGGGGSDSQTKKIFTDISN